MSFQTDMTRLAETIKQHDDAGNNAEGPDGKIAGCQGDALRFAAYSRAELMATGHSTLAKVLGPQQLEELKELMAAM